MGIRKKIEVEKVAIPSLGGEHRSTDSEATAEWKQVDMWGKRIDGVMDNIPLKDQYLKHRDGYLARAVAVEAVLAWDELTAALKKGDKKAVCAALPRALSWCKSLAFYHTPGVNTGGLVKNLRRIVDGLESFYGVDLDVYCENL